MEAAAARPQTLPILVSIILVVHNEAGRVGADVRAIAAIAAALVSDYEIVIVDNGSSDDSQEVLRRLTAANGEPNLQVYTLESQVNGLIARWVGIENSLGDLVVCLEPRNGDIDQLERLIRAAAHRALPGPGLGRPGQPVVAEPGLRVLDAPRPRPPELRPADLGGSVRRGRAAAGRRHARARLSGAGRCVPREGAAFTRQPTGWRRCQLASDPCSR